MPCRFFYQRMALRYHNDITKTEMFWGLIAFLFIHSEWLIMGIYKLLKRRSRNFEICVWCWHG